jgi:GNAT superfamily N-acetyltransferase
MSGGDFSRLDLQPLTPARAADLEALLAASGEDPCACRCTAYHGAGGERPEAARTCRERIGRESPPDGYLLYEDGGAVAWAQCAPWRSCAALRARAPQEPDAWALTCVVVAPDRRGRGLAHALVRAVVARLREEGAGRLYAFAHRLGPTYSSPLPELPESVCAAAGLRLVRDDPECPLYATPVPRPP